MSQSNPRIVRQIIDFLFDRILLQDLMAIMVEGASRTMTSIFTLNVSCVSVRFVVIFLTF